jgi:hypothetical protein
VSRLRLRDHQPHQLSRVSEGERRVNAPAAKNRRITGIARAELAEQLKTSYEGGSSVRALAQASQRSYGGVHLLLFEAGVVFRGRGGRQRAGGEG